MPEVARKFLDPAPPAIVEHLVGHDLLSPEEAALGAALPIAEDLTVEADSGGHTDRRPLGALFPAIVDLAREVAVGRGWSPPRVGAGGGLGTPASLASAFALGAAYVVTGSVNQSCVESGIDADGCLMLSQAELPDVIMAPAADMFELGVDVQVLRRGTMFGTRGRRLYELYRGSSSLEELDVVGPGMARGLHLRQERRGCLARDQGVLGGTRSGAIRSGRGKPQAQAGTVVSQLPRSRQPVGDRRSSRPADRLPDLVQLRDGGLQLLGGGVVPRSPREPHRRAGGAKSSRGSSRRDPGSAASHCRPSRATRGLRVSTPIAAVTGIRTTHRRRSMRPRNIGQGVAIGRRRSGGHA